MDELIIEDLRKRNLKITAFLCRTEDGGIQLIQYDNKGNAVYISALAYDGVSVYQNTKGGAIIGMGELPKQ